MPTFGDAFAERMLHRGSEPDSERPMPVTAKLSKAFYDQLGEKVTDELVNWLNDVDATYRADLRAFNELNFSRFDAKLEQRLAQFDARIEQRIAQLEAKVEKRFVELEAKFEQRFVELEAKFEQRFALVDQRFVQLDSKIDRRVGELRELLERRLREQDRHAFRLYAAMIALFVTIVLRT